MKRKLSPAFDAIRRKVIEMEKGHKLYCGMARCMAILNSRPKPRKPMTMGKFYSIMFLALKANVCFCGNPKVARIFRNRKISEFAKND